jgi:very-short-patch-repair endonuclease
MTARARILRNNATGPECQLRRLLRELRPLGVHFRRQVPFGPYVLDFACHHARLVVEIDGDTHGSDEAIARDELRDDFLKRAGYDVIRLGNEEVLKNLDGVGILLHEVLSTKPLLPPRLPPTPTPPLQGEGRARAASPGGCGFRK